MSGTTYRLGPGCGQSVHKDERAAIPAQALIFDTARESIKVCLRCVERINEGEMLPRAKKLRTEHRKKER